MKLMFVPITCLLLGLSVDASNEILSSDTAIEWSIEGREELARQVERVVQEVRDAVKEVRGKNNTCRYEKAVECRTCVKERCEQRAVELDCNSVTGRITQGIETVCRFTRTIFINGTVRTTQVVGEECMNMTHGLISSIGSLSDRLSIFDDFFSEKLIPVLTSSVDEFLSEFSLLTEDISDHVSDMLNEHISEETLDTLKTGMDTIRTHVNLFGDTVNDFHGRLWNFSRGLLRPRESFRDQMRRQMQNMHNTMNNLFGRLGFGSRTRREVSLVDMIHEIEPNCSEMNRIPVQACMVYIDHCEACQPHLDIEVCDGLEEAERRLQEADLKLACLRNIEGQNWKYNIQPAVGSGRPGSNAIVGLFGKRVMVPIARTAGPRDVASQTFHDYINTCLDVSKIYLDPL